ncbi:hypothetical protein FE257_001926 [Aspergillus nanangensis]|uniref:Uncharacterized protein n=1 Tax=Aspergillus nanangensis TaxID=2582783 RepID=A0AAD4CD68_ASPNN|nr:hypothetical protein FE257_001926 [Aspergillus nanangensis]
MPRGTTKKLPLTSMLLPLASRVDTYDPLGKSPTDLKSLIPTGWGLNDAQADAAVQDAGGGVGATLEGIEVGDLGMKMAYNATCNGYLRFRGVRVSRDSLLAANAGVLADGSYRVNTAMGAAELWKRLYVAMLDMQYIIMRCAGFMMAQTLTVATRYLVIQHEIEDVGDEYSND